MTRPCGEGYCDCRDVVACLVLRRELLDAAEAKESLARHGRSLALDSEWLAMLAERGGR